MSALKDQDPDYGPSAANNEKHQRIYEENGIYWIFDQNYMILLFENVVSNLFILHLF